VDNEIINLLVNSNMTWAAALTIMSIVLRPALVTGLASGTHVFQPVWKTDAGTAFTWATTGAAPIIMWAREVS